MSTEAKRVGAKRHEPTTVELDALKREAMQSIAPYAKRGDPLEWYLKGKPGGACPGDPAIWYAVGSCLFENRDGTGARIELKRDEIGVIFYYRDGRSSYAVFSVPVIWDDIVNPKPEQLRLPLFDSIQIVKGTGA
jgi:hypothetical protein